MPLLMVMMCSRHGRGSSGMVVATAAREETTALDARSCHTHAHTVASPTMGAGGGGWDGGCVMGGVTTRGEEAASDAGRAGGGDGTAAGETMHFGGCLVCGWLLLKIVFV
jgi:hypothetical protein